MHNTKTAKYNMSFREISMSRFEKNAVVDSHNMNKPKYWKAQMYVYDT